MVFSQGDVIELNFDPTKGHEPQKRRPAVVVSTYDFNLRSSLTFVAPITSTFNDYPLHVRISEETDDVHGMICLEATRSVDLEVRASRRIGALCDEDLSEVLNRLAPIFGL